MEFNTNKFVLSGHTSYVVGLKLVYGDLLASGSYDKTIRLWNVTSGALIQTLANHTDWILWSLDLMADGQTFLSGSFDKTLKLWNVNTGKVLNTINTTLNIESMVVLNSKKGKINGSHTLKKTKIEI